MIAVRQSRWKLRIVGHPRVLLLLLLTLGMALLPSRAITMKCGQNKPESGALSKQVDKRAAARQAFDDAERLRLEGTTISLKSALEKYQQSRELWQQVGDQRWEATTLNNIGSVYESLGDNQQALDCFNQALSISSAMSDGTREAMILNNIAGVYKSQGEDNKALDSYNKALALVQAVPDYSLEATILSNIGILYHLKGDDQEALSSYNRGLAVERASGDRSREGQLLHNIGGIYASRGDAKTALDYYNQAITIIRVTGPRFGEAIILESIGRVYESQGEKQKALDYFIKALPIERAESELSLEAGTLSNTASVYDSLGEKQKALDYYNQALPLQRAVGDRSGEAETLYHIGSVYNVLGETQQAQDYLNKALTIAREVGARSAEAATLTGIGDVYSSLGEKQKALDYYNQALPIRRAVGDQAGEATALNRLGQLYLSLGQPQEALDHFQQALAIRRAVVDPLGESSTLSNIGTVYSSTGENQKALDYYNQSLRISRVIDNRRSEAATWNNIGATYTVLGEIQKALYCYKHALLLARAVKDRSGEAATLDNIGQVYISLGQDQNALDVFKQALSIRREVRDRSGEATTLNSIGVVYNRPGERQKSLYYYDQALQIERAVGDHPGEASTLNNIGCVYLSLGAKQDALDFFNQSLPILRAVGNRSGEATTLSNIGYVYDSLGKHEIALHFYSQALSLDREVGDRSSEAATLYGIAGVDLAAGRTLEARRNAEEASAMIESLQAEVVSPGLRLSFLSARSGYSDLYVEVLMQLHRQEPGGGYDRLAFEASEKARARSLLDLLNEAKAHVYRRADPELLEREASIRQQLDAQSQLRTKVLNGPHIPKQLSELELRVRALTTQYQEVEVELRQNSPQYASLTQPHIASVRDVQQQLLDSDTILLEYKLGKERSYLWLLTSTTLTSYELPKRQEIEQISRQVYALLKAPGDRRVQAEKEYESTAAALSNLVLGKVASQLGNRRLLIVADGALNYIPFGALPAPTASATAGGTESSFAPLLVDHEVVQLPSASVLSLLRQETVSRQIPPKDVFVLADPVFSAEDPRVKHRVRLPASSAVAQIRSHSMPGVGGNGEASEIEASQLARSAGDVGVSQGGVLPRLVGTRREARSIVALAPNQSKLVLDFDANRVTATSAELAQYRYVHFATHGFVDAEHPELSGLVLSTVNESGDAISGFLRLQDIFNLDLPVELVVLSGCETGIGKEVRGEGLLGLTRGFMYAGAPRVVVSLWKVDDLATAKLMTRFYGGMLQQKRRPAAALRAAQLAMWQDKEWRQPYYWAAFVLQGEWN